MKPIVAYLLLLQSFFRHSQASQIIDPDELFSRMKASTNNSVTLQVSSELLQFCRTDQLCKDKMFQLCDGGGRCQVQWETSFVNNRLQHLCTIRMLDCKPAESQPKKSYNQVLEELKKTGVSKFFERNVGNCMKVYCTDQFIDDIRALGYCHVQYRYPNTCIVHFQIRDKFPDIPKGLSREEIFQRSLQAGGVDIETRSEAECLQSCTTYQRMCSKNYVSTGCQYKKYTQRFKTCNIRIKCLSTHHQRGRRLNPPSRGWNQKPTGQRKRKTFV